MLKVILDTNFLLLPFLFKIDIFAKISDLIDEPYEVVVLPEVVDELKKILEEQAGKHRDAASFALKMVTQKGLEGQGKSLYMNINSKDSFVDDIILKIAGPDTIVATQDSGLSRRLKENKVRVIRLRGKKILEIG